MAKTRLIYQDIEAFKESIDEAFNAAIDGDTVEIWFNGDYCSLTFHSLQANDSGKTNGK